MSDSKNKNRIAIYIMLIVLMWGSLGKGEESEQKVEPFRRALIEFNDSTLE
jgi:hypothetical protein